MVTAHVEEHEMVELIIEILLGAVATALVTFMVDAARTRLRPF